MHSPTRLHGVDRDKFSTVSHRRNLEHSSVKLKELKYRLRICYYILLCLLRSGVISGRLGLNPSMCMGKEESTCSKWTTNRKIIG